jgi:hypothetical protein
MKYETESLQLPRTPDCNVTRNVRVCKNSFEHIWGNGQHQELSRWSAEEEIEQILDTGTRKALRLEGRGDPQMPRGAGAKGVDGGKGDEGEERGEDMGLETVTWGTGERRAPPIGAPSVRPRSRASGGERGSGGGERGGG